MPSTTLNEIEINLNKFTLIDTPGLVDNGNVLNYVKEEMVKTYSKTRNKNKNISIKT